jgi:hypothetical protein
MSLDVKEHGPPFWHPVVPQIRNHLQLVCVGLAKGWILRFVYLNLGLGSESRAVADAKNGFDSGGTPGG